MSTTDNVTQNTVVVRGFGPHVRFKTTQSNAAHVRVVTNSGVVSVPLSSTTDLVRKVA